MFGKRDDRARRWWQGRPAAGTGQPTSLAGGAGEGGEPGCARFLPRMPLVRGNGHCGWSSAVAGHHVLCTETVIARGSTRFHQGLWLRVERQVESRGRRSLGGAAAARSASGGWTGTVPTMSPTTPRVLGQARQLREPLVHRDHTAGELGVAGVSRLAAGPVRAWRKPRDRRDHRGPRRDRPGWSSARQLVHVEVDRSLPSCERSSGLLRCGRRPDSGCGLAATCVICHAAGWRPGRERGSFGGRAGGPVCRRSSSKIW